MNDGQVYLIVLLTLVLVIIILLADSLVLMRQVKRLEQQTYADKRYIKRLEDKQSVALRWVLSLEKQLNECQQDLDRYYQGLTYR